VKKQLEESLNVIMSEIKEKEKDVVKLKARVVEFEK